MIWPERITVTWVRDIAAHCQRWSHQSADLESQLHRHVLASIADNNCDDPRACADAALMTITAWCDLEARP